MLFKILLGLLVIVGGLVLYAYVTAPQKLPISRSILILESQGAATQFTWTINEFAMIPRLISRFVNLDKIIGGQLEKGLAKFKTITESKNQK